MMSDFELQDEPEAIAIIGMAGRFPQAKNVDEFWQKLRDGVELITFFTDEELRASGASEEMLKDPSFVKAGGVMDDIDLFDAAFFGYSPREAEILDPQQRNFLECAWGALENAGYDADRFKGLIGVFAGVSLNSYLLSNIGSNPALVEQMGTFQIGISSDKDFLATRVSYELNLKGPSMNIQTACSTSLVTIHVACQSLLNGECDIALAGGASISILKKMGYFYREGGISSPDGHCRAFDAKGQGIVGGNGVGIVVLKRLAEAVEDRDNIIAVIKGSTINNDGSAKIGYTAPSVEGQAKAIAEAQAIAGVDAESITYIETHGTGTNLGDPIEVAALTQSFRATTQKKGFCAIGSVKTNVGHLDAAAGVTGIIKTALSLRHKMLPPSLHFENPNPRIDFANSPFYVNAKLAAWERGSTPRRAGVSSFGIGGTNAHIIMEEAPAIEASGESRPYQLLALSAKTPTALDLMTANLIEHLKQNADANVADVAFTLQVGRKIFNHRRTLVCRDAADAAGALESLDARRVSTSMQEEGSRSVVFMFSGQGAQYPNMSLHLYEHEPTFRAHVDRCGALLAPHLGCDLREVLYPGAEESEAAAEKLKQTSLAQPALFVVEYALAQLLMEWGVRPQAMIGHSIGEYVAACLSGVFSLEDALALVAQRGRLMQQMRAGAMLSVRLAEKDAASLLNAGLSLAAVNAPSQCVIAGETSAIDALQKQLAERKVECSRLHTSHAFHSEMMQPALAPFIEQVKRVKRSAPRIPFISNVTGTWINADEATDPQYWGRHLGQTVRFASGLQELLKEANRIFVEVGPGQTLSTLTRQQLNGTAAQQIVLPTLRAPHDAKSDVEFLLIALGRLWMAGTTVDWSGFYTHECRRRMPLPSYPFERQRYWIEPGKLTLSAVVRQLPTGKLPDIAQWFYAPLWKQTHLPERTGSPVGDGENERWLVFAGEDDFGESLAGRLNQEGRDVCRVVPGQEFARLDENTYKINPRERADYEALFHDLRTQGKLPKRIVHTWSAGPADEQLNGELFEQEQSRGFYSLLFIAQSLSRQNFNDALQLSVVSSNAREVTGAEMLAPERATVLASCKVISQEYPHIVCRSIDLDLPARRDAEQDALLDPLLAELNTEPRDLNVAYRGRRRWVETFAPVRVEGSQSRSLLKRGGVYLIAGGLGRKGLVLAEYLARSVQAKLILTGRSGFPARDGWEAWLSSHDEGEEVSRKIRRLKSLEELGAEVLIARADVADLKQMQSVVEQADARFGRLDGLIHAAVQTDGFMQAIQETGLTHCREQFRPKTHALIVLEEVLRDRQLDFCVLMSSLSSVLGGLGFYAFAAANTFMDAFAGRQNRRGTTPWISIAWDGWSLRDEGKEADANTADTGITAREGMEVFERLMSHQPFTPVVISTGDLQARISQWVSLESLRDKGEAGKADSPKGYTRPNLPTPYVAPTTGLESDIAEIWQGLLGIEQVGIHDNLFDLGGDSLLVIQIVSRIRESLHIEVPLRAIFETPTIAELAASLDKLLQSMHEDTEKVAETLNLVEQMSDEELEALLAEQER
ncbi:MAG: acyltransferase domain-containing protein [Acidobacteria bacterium]|nr:acyltransferase domain-containing protein [Acidobacteriota bacterium]